MMALMAQPTNIAAINSRFLGKDPSTGEWSEAEIQMYIVQESRRAGITVTACMEQGRRSRSTGGKAKAMGMTAGMPDLLFWLDGGKVVPVELKTDKGRLSPAQNIFHGVLRKRGFSVYTVFAATPVGAYEKITEIINAELHEQNTHEETPCPHSPEEPKTISP